MIDPTTLIPIISGVISASVRIGVAIHTWWKNQRDQKTQHMAFEASRPTSQSASELHSLMDVQSSFWRTNPGMWQALGGEAASRPVTDRKLICRCVSGVFQVEWVCRSASTIRSFCAGENGLEWCVVWDSECFITVERFIRSESWESDFEGSATMEREADLDGMSVVYETLHS
jgi:hypothetical protein